MLEPESGADDLQAVIAGETVLIRVIGRGSFKVSATLKQFITETSSHQPVAVVAIDLGDCIGMDSTFMGVLAGLSGRLRQSGQTLELINLSEKNRRLLATLGVDQIIQYYSDTHGHQLPQGSGQSLPTKTASRKDLAETALCAHENLVRISEENRPRFKKVIEFLRADIDRLNE